MVGLEKVVIKENNMDLSEFIELLKLYNTNLHLNDSYENSIIIDKYSGKLVIIPQNLKHAEILIKMPIS